MKLTSAEFAECAGAKTFYKEMPFEIDRVGGNGIKAFERVERRGKQIRERNLKEFRQQYGKALNADATTIDPWGNNLMDEEVTDKIYRDDKGFDVLLKERKRKLGIRSIRSLKTDVELKGISKKVTVPMAGASYNPDEEARQETLKKALEISNATAKYDDMWNEKISAAKLHKTQRPGEAEVESEEESVPQENSDLPFVSYNKKVSRDDRKTISQKNKEKKVKAELKAFISRKKELMKIKQINSLSYIFKDLKKSKFKNAEARKKLQLLKQSRTADDWAALLRLGNSKFRASVPEVAFTENIGECGSFRKMVPQGNLLKDQFLNFQKYGVIERTKPADWIVRQNSCSKFVKKDEWKERNFN